MEIFNFNIQARNVYAENDFNRERVDVTMKKNNKQEIHHLLTRLDDHVSSATAQKHVINNNIINFESGDVLKVFANRHKLESKLLFSHELREHRVSHSNIAKKLEHIDTTQLALRNDRLRRNSEMAKIEKNIEDIANVSVLRHAFESNDEGKTFESYGKFWDKIAKDIASIKKEYVEFYATLISKYADFYQVFVKLQGEIAVVVSEGKDGNHIKFDNGEKMKAFEHFRDARDAIKLPKIEGWSKDNLTDEQKQLRENLRPAFIIDDDGQVKIDDTAYQNLPNEPAGRDKDNNVNMASYNRHSAPNLGINSTVSIAENINDGLVNRIEVRYLRWSVTNTELVNPTKTKENPTRCGFLSRFFLHIWHATSLNCQSITYAILESGIDHQATRHYHE